MTPMASIAGWYHFVRTATGNLFPVMTGCRIAQSLAGTVQAFVVMRLLGQLAQGGSMTADVVALAACLICTMGLQVLLGHLSTVIKERVQCYLNREILDAVTDMPTVEHHRAPETAERIEYLKRETWRTMDTAWAPFDLAVTVTNLVLIMALMVTVQPLLVLVPLVGLTRVIGSVAGSRRVEAATKAASGHRRRADALVSLATDPDHWMELRSYGAGALVLDELSRSEEAAAGTSERARRVACVLELAGRWAFALSYSGVIVFVLARASTASAAGTASALVLLVLVMARIERVSAGLAAGGAQLSQVMYFLAELRALRDAARQAVTAAAPGDAAPGVTLEGVRFRYPGQERPALDGVDVWLPPGTVAAVVGLNGAGKTTLAELVLGLYRPERGRVLVGGDMEGGAPVRPELSAALQRGARFQFSLRDAVVLGRDPGPAEKDSALTTALAAASAEEIVGILPDGVDTVLGSFFAGARELSGGQWQRVTNAAALYSPSTRVLVLDEPTSAIDPRVEDAILESLVAGGRRIGEQGGICLLVSHRLAVAKDVDVVLVLHEGRVVEAGAHADLVSRDGPYGRLYAQQSAMYR